jgi:hypothetical protein
MNRPQEKEARPAATKTVPREGLAQRRRGAEKDQEETRGLVFSVSLRLRAKKSLRECVILTDCSAKIAKKESHKLFSLSSLHRTPAASRHSAKILPRMMAESLTQSRQVAKTQRVFPLLASLRLCAFALKGPFLSVSIRSAILFGCGFAALRSFAAKILLEWRDFSWLHRSGEFSGAK